MTVAAVDIGTNSTRLLIGDDRRTTITRLGQGVDGSGRLHPDAVERTLAVLREYGAAIEAAGATKVRAVATSAVRDAANGDDFLDRAATVYPERAGLIRGFRANWHEMVSHHYADSVAIMEGLIDEGHDVTMLTNFAADTFIEAQERFPFLKKPRGVTVSGEIGLIKPDRAIYDRHAETFALEPAASLFIDDSQKNVDGAIAAGWQAVLFTDAARLAQDLRQRGVAVPTAA